MFYIVNCAKVYRAEEEKAVPVNVSAAVNQLTGALLSYTVEDAGDPVDTPDDFEVATIDEVIARFSCSVEPYKFPAKKRSAAKSKKKDEAPKDDEAVEAAVLSEAAESAEAHEQKAE